ncbi:MAG: protein kinase [Thermoanaerobaculia bacterium]|nr:protein kinase [Thermoanaerobaculia bacterium]
MSRSAESRWTVIDSILDRALDAPPAERHAVAESACRGDEELVAKVRQLLDAALRAESAPDVRLASRTPEVFDRALARLDRSDLLPPGSLVGAYRILDAIGAGGMGQVYLAERADGQFERRVALKVLAGWTADLTSRSRFQRERQILAGLDHDHIAMLLDGGLTDDGRPFFVLRYVDGVPITDFCTEHRLGRDERIALFLQACEAVQYAHGQGVVHRDIKPANLLVSERDDGPPHLSVLDFGIARIVGVVDLTRTGDVIGTPAYMAPEQARGEVESVDRRADVFALGVVLYELLCDRRPFDGSTPAEILAAVLRADPSEPRALISDLPRDLETVILTCLESDPGRRYGAVRSFAEDLRRYLRGEPITARSRSPWRRLKREIRRRPVQATVVIAILLSSLIGGSSMLWQKALALRGAEVASRYGRAAEEISATMRFEHLIALHDTAPARRRLAARLSRLESGLGNVPSAARSEGRLAVGRGYLSLGQLDRALEHLDVAWSSGLGSAAAALTLAEAEVERYRRDRARAEQITDPVLRQARLAELAIRSRDRALKLRSMATEELERGDLVAARIAFLEDERDRAAELAERALELAPWRYEVYLLHGEIELANLSDARGRGDMEGVLQYLQRGRLAFRAAAEIAPSDPEPHLQLCRIAAKEVDLHLHDVSGSVDVAAEDGAAACASAHAADTSSPDSFIAASALGVVYARDLSRRDEDPFLEIDEAIVAAEQAVLLAADDVRAYRRLGDAWTFRAEFERERGIESSASIAAGVVPLERAIELAPDDAGVWNSLGLLRWEEVLRAQARSEDHRQATQAAIEAFAEAVSIEPGYAYAWGNLGTMYNRLADAAIDHGENALPHLESAENALRKALEIYPAYVTAHNNLGNVIHNRGEFLQAQGENSLASFRHAVEEFDRIAALKPDWAFPHFNRARSGVALATAMLARGEDPGVELEAARKALSIALELRNDIVDGHLLAAELELAQARRAILRNASPRPAMAAAHRAIRNARRLDPESGGEQERELLELESAGSPR